MAVQNAFVCVFLALAVGVLADPKGCSCRRGPSRPRYVCTGGCCSKDRDCSKYEGLCTCQEPACGTHNTTVCLNHTEGGKRCKICQVKDPNFPPQCAVWNAVPPVCLPPSGSGVIAKMSGPRQRDAITCPAVGTLRGVRLTGHIMGFAKTCPSVNACCDEAKSLRAMSFTYNPSANHTPIDPACRFFGYLEPVSRWDFNCTTCVSFAANSSFEH